MIKVVVKGIDLHHLSVYKFEDEEKAKSFEKHCHREGFTTTVSEIKKTYRCKKHYNNYGLEFNQFAKKRGTNAYHSKTI